MKKKFDISAEFDELMDLAMKLGFKGEQVEEFAAEVLHSINDGIKKVMFNGEN